MKKQKMIKAGNALVKENGIFLTVFVGTEDDGTCTVDAFEDITELKDCIDEIREMKREAACIQESDGASFTGDMFVAIALEDVDYNEVKCEELSDILKKLDIEGLYV